MATFVPFNATYQNILDTYFVAATNDPATFRVLLTDSSTYTSASTKAAVIAEETNYNGGDRQALTFTASAYDGGQTRAELPRQTATFVPNSSTISYDRAVLIADANTTSWGEVIDGTTNTQDAGNNKFLIPSHPFANDEPVVLVNGAGVRPAEFSAATLYYVVNSAAGEIQLASTVGGAAINFSAGTNGFRIHSALGTLVGYVDLGTPDPIAVGSPQDINIDINMGGNGVDVNAA